MADTETSPASPVDATGPLDPGAIAPLLRGQFFEEVEVGARFRTAYRTITEADLVGFITLAGLNEPLFMDEQGPREAGYTGRLVPGALTFAYAEGLIMQSGVIHGTGMAFMHADLDIAGPVFVGDTIVVVVEVLEARAARTASRGKVTTGNTVITRGGGVVLTYEAIRLIRGQEG